MHLQDDCIWGGGSNNQQTDIHKIKLHTGLKVAMFVILKVFLQLQEKRGNQLTNLGVCFYHWPTRVPQIDVQTLSLQTWPSWAVL